MEIVTDHDIKGYAVVDLETTGRSNEDHIIEVGVVLMNLDGTITHTLSSLVRPPVHIRGESTKIHGITNEMVRHAPVINTLGTQVIGSFESRYLVAHNAHFESRFLTAAFGECDLEFLPENFVDTLVLARKYLKLSSHKLANVSAHYGHDLEDPHKALNDAYATALVLRGMLKDSNVPAAATRGVPFYADDYEGTAINPSKWVSR